MTVERRNARLLDAASFLVLALATVVALATWRDYGITWDEEVHASYGRALLDFFTSVGADTSAVRHRDCQYGPGFDLFAAAVDALGPIGKYPSLRFAGAFVGLLGVIGVFRLSRLLAGPLGGFLGVVLTVFTPVYYGHMFANPKDLPFAAAYVWSVYYLVRIARAFPCTRPTDFVLAGVACGLASSIRIGGLVLIGYLGAAVVLLLVEHALGRPGAKPFARNALRLVAGAALTVVLGYALMIALWPWAQGAPFERPFQTAQRFASYSRWAGTTLYDGEWLRTTAVPWDYPLRYALYQLPEAVLGFFGLGAIGVTAATLAAPFRRKRLPMGEGIVLVAAVAPIAIVIVRDVIVYDGIRQLLFFVPAACALAAVAAARTIAWLGHRSVVLAAVPALAIAVLTADTARSMAELHPYQYIHYNRLVGGFEGADGKWDGEYYGASFKEALARLAEHLWATEPERYLAGTYAVMTSAQVPFFLTAQATENFVWVHPGARTADFFVSYTRHGLDRRFRSQPLVLAVKRQSRVINVVRDLREP